MPLLFVYGTLMRGRENHAHLQGQRCLGPARTTAGYRLYQLDGYPGMVEAKPDGLSIEGELWEVDLPARARLDQFEGVAEGLYRRAKVALAPPHETIEAETYLYNHPTKSRQDLGTRFPA